MTDRSESLPQTPQRGASAGRIVAIDSLRGIAACSVMVLHYLNEAKNAYGLEAGIWQFGLGNCGVQLFFMISGFVIFQTLERRPRVLDFAFARFSRLYPPYWASIFLAYFLTITTGLNPSRDVGRLYVLINLTMIQPLFGVITYVPIHWTLYIEVQFYVVMALLTVCRLRSQIPVILAALVVLATLGAAGAIPGWPVVAAFVPLLRHLHLFLYGICLYRWDHLSVGSRAVLLGVCAVNALVLGVVVDPKPYSGVPYSIPVFVLSGLFALAAKGHARWLEQPFLIGLGVISYSLYLMHEPFGDIFLKWSAMNGVPVFVALAIAFAAALALATLMTYAVERPTQRLLSGWWKKKENGMTAATAPTPSGVAAP